jgi:hypothetical protein
MEFVRGKKPTAVETFEAPGSSQSRILQELVRIREILEKQTQKDGT